MDWGGRNSSNSTQIDSCLGKSHVHNVLQYEKGCSHQLASPGQSFNRAYFNQEVIIQLATIL
jgi:hypothetical protein